MLPLWAIQIIFVGAVIGGGYWYFTTTQETLASNAATISTLELSLDRKEKQIESKNKVITKERARSKELFVKLGESENGKAELIQIFQEHDLKKLAIAKPDMIEKIINAGTDDAFSNLESLTATDGM